MYIFVQTGCIHLLGLAADHLPLILGTAAALFAFQVSHFLQWVFASYNILSFFLTVAYCGCRCWDSALPAAWEAQTGWTPGSSNTDLLIISWSFDHQLIFWSNHQITWRGTYWSPGRPEVTLWTRINNWSSSQCQFSHHIAFAFLWRVTELTRKLVFPIYHQDQCRSERTRWWSLTDTISWYFSWHQNCSPKSSNDSTTPSWKYFQIRIYSETCNIAIAIISTLPNTKLFCRYFSYNF